jgi:uncharacterized membrane protein
MSQSTSPGPQYASGSVDTRPWNTLSIVAFALSVVGISIVAIVLGHISLSQVKNRNERGRGFAIAALIIGYVTLVLEILAIVFALLFAAGLYATSGVGNRY